VVPTIHLLSIQISGVDQQQLISDFRSSLLNWAADNLRSFPWRKTSDPYEVLLAEILLQKTAAEKVEPIYLDVLSAYPTLPDLSEATPEELADLIYSLGLQNQRSKALVKIGRQLQHSGVPADAEQLLKLPYVGRYAANATLCFAFGNPRPIVDANVVRIYNRIFDFNFEYDDEAAWEFAEEVLPPSRAARFNLGILDFAAAVCAPKTPHCEVCFFAHDCQYYRTGR